MSDAVLELAGLKRSFTQADVTIEVLRGVDARLKRGEIVALLGPSGSGKSSLMAVLAGLERARGGTVMVAGLDFATMDEDALARARH